MDLLFKCKNGCLAFFFQLFCDFSYKITCETMRKHFFFILNKKNLKKHISNAVHVLKLLGKIHEVL